MAERGIQPVQCRRVGGQADAQPARLVGEGAGQDRPPREPLEKRLRVVRFEEAEKRACAAGLIAMALKAGVQRRGACPLFRLIETDDAQALFDRLARQAILTRPFADQPCWLRIGLPADSAALDRLDAALGHG